MTKTVTYYEIYKKDVHFGRMVFDLVYVTDNEDTAKAFCERHGKHVYTYEKAEQEVEVSE